MFIEQMLSLESIWQNLRSVSLIKRRHYYKKYYERSDTGCSDRLFTSLFERHLYRMAIIMGYLTGTTIKSLRERQGLTQKELADKIGVSDKAISKWETNRGLPDISIIEELSKSLGASPSELLSGEIKTNRNVSGNMKRLQFYVCPICGNVITAVGEGCISCCGINLPKQIAEPIDDSHVISVSSVEDEYLVTINHPMHKEHYISFISYVTSNTVETVKLYPEQDISVRFRPKGRGFIYAFCNIHGMYKINV